MSQNVWELINGKELKSLLNYINIYKEENLSPDMKRLYDMVEKRTNEIRMYVKPDTISDRVVKAKLDQGYSIVVFHFSEFRGISFEYDIGGFKSNSIFSFRAPDGLNVIENFL